MGILTIAIAGLLVGLAAVSLPLATILFLGVMSIIPASVSIDLGSGMPLITPGRLLMPVLVGGLMVGCLRAGRLYVPYRASLLLGTCCLGLFCSVAFSTAGPGSGLFRAVAFAVEDFGLFLLAYHILDSRRKVLAIVKVLTASLILVCGLAFVELITRRNPLAEMAPALRSGLVFDYSLEDRFGLPRLQSVFRNPLDFGIFLQLTVPIALGLGLALRREMWGTLGVIGGLCGCACAILTGSRSVIYTFVVTIGAFTLLSRKWLWGMVTLGLVLGTIGVVAATTGFPLRDYVIRSAIAPELYQGDVGGSSIFSLLRVSGEHLRMAMQRPLFGWGMGTLPPNPGGERFDIFYVGLGEQGITYMLVESGLLGLLGFLGTFAVVWRTLHRACRSSPNCLDRTLTLTILAGSIGFLAGAQLEGIWHLDLLLVLFAVGLRCAGNHPGAVNRAVRVRGRVPVPDRPVGAAHPA